MAGGNKDYLTTKTPWKAILIFLVPIILGNLFQKLYTTVDSVIVGRLVSQDALAATGACDALTNVFISVAIGGGIGASVIVGRDFGAKAYARMKTAVFTAILSFLALSLALAAVGLVFSRAILIALKTPGGDVLTMANAYLSIYFLGLPFLFLYNVLSALFNCLGKSRIPLYFLIFSSLLNVALDILFVAQFHMGVPGVAWATLIAQGSSALMSLAVFIRTLKDITRESGSLFSGVSLREMTRIALPSILQQSTISMGYLFIQSVINSFGKEVMAGFTAAMKVEKVCVVPMTSISTAMSSYTAQNLGAGKEDRVRKGLSSALLMVASFSVLVAIVLVGFGKNLAIGFLGEKSSDAALSAAVGYLKFTGLFYFGIGSKMAFDGVLRGSGDTFMFTVANLVNLGLRVAVAMIMAPSHGMQWIWYAVPIGWFINLTLSSAEYRTGKWRTKLKKA